MAGLRGIRYLLTGNVCIKYITYLLLTNSTVACVQNTKMAVRETADVGIKLVREAHFPDDRYKMTNWRQVVKKMGINRM